MIRELTALLLVALSVRTHEQEAPLSPCPGVFEYELNGTEPGRWDGVVHLSTNGKLQSLLLSIVLDRKANILASSVGAVTTKDNRRYKIENSEFGSEEPVRFFVTYNVLEQTPKLHAIILNGREICNANTPLSDQLPTTKLTGTASTEKPDKEYYTGGFDYPHKHQCGRVLMNKVLPLVLGGTPTLEGQWPWQVALHQTVIDKFICGGTLVSRRHVITAAHCVTFRLSTEVINESTLIVYMGKHNLKTSKDGVQIAHVKKIIVSPLYNITTYNGDISILELREIVSYSNWVQPACLWPENKITLDSVVGMRGSVVGWGFDGTNLTSDELLLAEMPVVDTWTCIRSNVQFYPSIVAYGNNYCAGYIDGRSVCNGDSGGGMVFQIEGSWYLRGLVSVAAAKDHNFCDPSQYVVFTDVAQFLPWIKENIDDY